MIGVSLHESEPVLWDEAIALAAAFEGDVLIIGGAQIYAAARPGRCADPHRGPAVSHGGHVFR